MERYKGKSKCSCGRRAKFRVIKNAGNLFACEHHEWRLQGQEADADNARMTEADRQTWARI